MILINQVEKGYAAIPGAMAKPINTWGEFLSILRELKTDQAKEAFNTIIVDTADIAYDLCERYICAQNDVDAIGDIPYGKGYGLVAQEFDEKLRSIVQMDYGLVMISHSQDKTFKDESGEETQRITPTLPNKAQTIVSRMCDIIGYSRAVLNEKEELETRLFMRGTPRFVAGSRFKDTPTSIVFTYDNLVNTIHDAVSALEVEYGLEATTDAPSHHNAASPDQRDIEDVLAEFNEVAGTLMTQDAQRFGPRIQRAVENHFGRGKKINEATLDQVDLAESALAEIKDFLKA